VSVPSSPWSLESEFPNSERFGGWQVNTAGETALSQFSRTVWLDEWLRVLGEPNRSDRFEISFGDAAAFVIDFSEKEIQILPSASGSPERVRQLLGDQILPRILAHGGNLVLHAAAVANEKGAILLIGTSGSGKSSLAASFHNRGSRLLGDDAIVVSTSGGAMAAHAVYRSLRLFPDSISALIEGRAELTPVASHTTKRNVVYLDDSRTEEPLPVRAAFLLEAARGESAMIERMASSEACMAFVEHSFWMDPTDLTRTKERMAQASALAADVPTFRLAYPREYSVLPVVHDAIVGALD
jgi:hypothetical protein